MGFFDWFTVSEKQPATPVAPTSFKRTSDEPLPSGNAYSREDARFSTELLASRIVAAMERNGYKLFKNQGEVNIVYIEGMDTDGNVNEDTPNHFNDLRLVISFKRGCPEILGMWEATTEPGKFWTHNRMNSKGTARIKFGQYTAWIVGMHNGDHEGLLQRAGTVTVHRDTDENYIRPGDPLDTGYFGINHHHGYDLPKDKVDRASAGCLVGRSISGHTNFMRIVKSDPRYKKDNKFVYTATIMPAGEVV